MSAEFLFTTVPETGHMVPLAPFAAELVRRGNRVRWYTGSRLKGLVEATGAEFLAMPPEWEPDQSDLAATFPERAELIHAAGPAPRGAGGGFRSVRYRRPEGDFA